ncbi:monovalent cation/H+ antiporter subunit D family protein [Halomonas campisalis]|uniref:Monovalent cation/H+ antiporter subunit D family protein n=1 Tax=Billgrantia campisalis TaxID=74661 RepID=A0ABS9P8Y9_9GAMM|nr:monovalent cation/H+ antiporter subunit D family protein [Halomonas campisalis]MCG6657682.1 monovalent cation/H+ antiporter subunit D family protein [Halomonas campisalis]MDR5862546.1 monovalent cation/H+ antiporter subunit D family protein [Halomonas campisalis]
MGLLQLHLPALQVIIPMLAAPLVMLMSRLPRAAWLTTTLTSWLTLAISLLLLMRVRAEGVVAYHMGGWVPPVGIEYRVDSVNILVLLVISVINAVVMPFARLSVASEVPADKQGFFYAAFLLANCGLLGIAITGDAFNIFVFFEIAALASYSLIATGRDRRAVMASYQYLMMGTIGTTFLLIGIGFLYIMTGTLNLQDLADRLPEVNDTRTVRAALAFIVVGISLKLALFPLHLWLPNAYAYAPSMVTVFLSATATKVAIYVLLRFIFGVFGHELSFIDIEMNLLLMPLAMLGILIPSIVAIFHTDIKRMFAYSSVAQVGYIILGISFASTLGLMASVLHLFNHAITKAALFMALGCIAYRLGGVSLGHLAGAGQRMPWTMTAFVIAGLSLIGVPLTAGFVTKWHLILAALDGGLWPIAIFILGTSVLALLYVWRVVEVAFFHEPDDRQPVREAPLSLLVPTWLLSLACLYFGIETSLPVGLAERAAEALMGGYR